MANGKFIQVNSTFNETFPILDLEDSNLLVYGSLIFVDALQMNLASLTASQSNVVNLASEKAKLIPSLTAGNSVTLGCELTGNANGIVSLEKTAKGGLHGWTTAKDTGVRMISPKSLISDYMENNTSHTFFVSLSHRITRPKGNDVNKASYSGATSNDSMSLWAFDSVNRFPPNGNEHLVGYDRQGVADNTIGVVYRAQASKGIYSSFGDFTPPFEQVAGWKVGDNCNWEYDSSNKQRPAHVFYSFYVEDLTVSGRTFEEVNTIYKARHDKMFATGGKYDGDTWTTPPNL